MIRSRFRHNLALYASSARETSEPKCFTRSKSAAASCANASGPRISFDSCSCPHSSASLNWVFLSTKPATNCAYPFRSVGLMEYPSAWNTGPQSSINFATICDGSFDARLGRLGSCWISLAAEDPVDRTSLSLAHPRHAVYSPPRRSPIGSARAATVGATRVRSSGGW